MHAAEAADTITETAEEKRHEARERFRNRAAVLIAILASIMAVCELGGDNAKNGMIDNNIKASDTWAFYQAKNVRQTDYRLAADSLKRAVADPSLSEVGRAGAEADLEKYEKTAARYEDEPVKDGKKQLEARAKGYEEARDVSHERAESFDYAQMLLQLAIVLGSVSILAVSHRLLFIAGVLGAVGAALCANGLLLLIPLPGG